MKVGDSIIAETSNLYHTGEKSYIICAITKKSVWLLNDYGVFSEFSFNYIDYNFYNIKELRKKKLDKIENERNKLYT